ncbi:hypothetical protein MWU53_11675, partial [Aliiroseovarius sp. S1123]|nr:hypothetical protein [Aliiroseovarius sp. S1123]
MELNAVKTSYARWAPVYDRTFGVITNAGRRTVRRQGFWNQWLRKLIESLAHLVGFIMRRGGGDASVAFRVSFV